MTAVFVALYAVLGTFAGLGLLSLSIQRHYSVQWPHRSGLQKNSRYDKTLLRLSGAACLGLAIAAALADNGQLGALFWSGYFMIAGLLVTALHSYAVRTAKAVTLVTTGLFGILTLVAPIVLLR